MASACSRWTHGLTYWYDAAGPTSNGFVILALNDPTIASSGSMQRDNGFLMVSQDSDFADMATHVIRPK